MKAWRAYFKLSLAEFIALGLLVSMLSSIGEAASEGDGWQVVVRLLSGLTLWLLWEGGVWLVENLRVVRVRQQARSRQAEATDEQP